MLFLVDVIDEQSFSRKGGVVTGSLPVLDQKVFVPGIALPPEPVDDSVRAFDRDTVAFTGVPGVIRDYEANLELTYTAQIVPGWWLQPNLQFIWHPSGDSSLNATVVGARSLWRY